MQENRFDPNNLGSQTAGLSAILPFAARRTGAMTNPEKRKLVDRIKTIEERLLIIVNPMSKKGSELASRTRSLVRREGMYLEETSTDHPDDFGSTMAFWSKRFGGSKVIMVFGGDGAINQVINNVMLSRSNKNVVLVPIPAGTANDFCRALGLDTVEGALGAMVDFNLRAIDLLKLEIDGASHTVKYCSNILGVGLDGDLAKSSQKYKRFGVPGYWYASLKKAAIAVVKGVPTYRVRVRAGSLEYQGPLVAVMFSNINKYGRSFRIAPRAQIDDGNIYMTIVKPMNIFRTFTAGLLLMAGLHNKMPGVESLVCKDAEIEVLDDVYTQEDGEVYFYPKGTTITLSLERKAINVLASSPTTTASI
jgi:diacylglycerol kinase family enzyme